MFNARYFLQYGQLAHKHKPWNGETSVITSYSIDNKPFTHIAFRLTSTQKQPPVSSIKFAFADTKPPSTYLFVTLGPGFSSRLLEQCELEAADRTALSEALSGNFSQELALTTPSIYKVLGKFDRLGIGPSWEAMRNLVEKAIEMHPNLAGLLRAEFMEHRAEFDEAQVEHSLFTHNPRF